MWQDCYEQSESKLRQVTRVWVCLSTHRHALGPGKDCLCLAVSQEDGEQHVVPSHHVAEGSPSLK